MPVLAGWAPCGHDGGEGMTGDSWSLGAHQSCDRAGSVLSESWAALSSAVTPRSQSLHSAMFGPNLHGDAAAGGASKIDLRGHRGRHWTVSLTASLWSDQGRDPPALPSNMARDEADIDQSLSPSNDWQLREHFSLITT